MEIIQPQEIAKKRVLTRVNDLTVRLPCQQRIIESENSGGKSTPFFVSINRFRQDIKTQHRGLFKKLVYREMASVLQNEKRPYVGSDQNLSVNDF